MLVALACLVTTPARSAQKLTVDNFVRAETDVTFKRYVAQGAFACST
jgi:hypothetical protein